jgi:dihydroorotate dehydrogenase electron transfer subunit
MKRGRIVEVRLDAAGQPEARLACPAGVIPGPGQYTIAYAEQEAGAALGTALFLAEGCEGGFWAASPLPSSWGPGTVLELRGILGHGFILPETARRVGLVALGDTAARLLPLARLAVEGERLVTLFSGTRLPGLPSWLEAYPLGALPEALSWPDFLALDVPLEGMSGMRKALGLEDGQWLPCPGQALVWTPMPCAGLAECGACAVPARRGFKLACVDGPVLDVRNLKW